MEPGASRSLLAPKCYRRAPLAWHSAKVPCCADGASAITSRNRRALFSCTSGCSQRAVTMVLSRISMPAHQRCRPVHAINPTCRPDGGNGAVCTRYSIVRVFTWRCTTTGGRYRRPRCTARRVAAGKPLSTERKSRKRLSTALTLAGRAQKTAVWSAGTQTGRRKYAKHHSD